MGQSLESVNQVCLSIMYLTHHLRRKRFIYLSFLYLIIFVQYLGSRPPQPDVQKTEPVSVPHVTPLSNQTPVALTNGSPVAESSSPPPAVHASLALNEPKAEIPITMTHSEQQHKHPERHTHTHTPRYIFIKPLHSSFITSSLPNARNQRFSSHLPGYLQQTSCLDSQVFVCSLAFVNLRDYE